MKEYGVRTVPVLALLALGACAPPTVITYTPYPTPEKNLALAETTLARLKTLAVGQSREEVLERMKTDPVKGCVKWSWRALDQYLRWVGLLPCARSETILSPYRTTALEKDGIGYEVLYYYTGGISPEEGITDAQLTPVLIADGRLAGWGWEHPRIKLVQPTLAANQP
jgi:hypothetical protein